MGEAARVEAAVLLEMLGMRRHTDGWRCGGTGGGEAAALEYWGGGAWEATALEDWGRQRVGGAAGSRAWEAVRVEGHGAARPCGSMREGGWGATPARG
jgi:hypothetical protein